MSEAKKFVYKSTPGIIVWPCKVSEPVNGGAREEATLTVRFNVLPQERIEEAFPRLAIMQDPKLARAFLEEAVVGFDGLTDDKGKSVDGQKVKAQLLAQPYIHDGVLEGYFDMIGRRLTKN